jgi:hypothetical protein
MDVCVIDGKQMLRVEGSNGGTAFSAAGQCWQYIRTGGIEVHIVMIVWELNVVDICVNG